MHEVAKSQEEIMKNIQKNSDGLLEQVTTFLLQEKLINPAEQIRLLELIRRE